MENYKLAWISKVATTLAFIVIVLGAYTRLTDAGLGCPDWPGCYGKLVVYDASHLDSAFNAKKAWTEMMHRYLAAGLGLIIGAIFIYSLLLKRFLAQTTLLLLLVILQATLGMLTVTKLLQPAIVLAHLLGGILIISILLNLTLQASVNEETIYEATSPKKAYDTYQLAKLALALTMVQIILGGMVSTNYAALVCSDFPGCGHIFSFAIKEAFNLFKDRQNIDGLSTLHMLHRLGAVFVASYLLYFAYRAWLVNRVTIKIGTLLLLLSLIIQIGLGIANVWYKLPLTTAVLHNAMAVILLLTLVTIHFHLKGASRA